MNGMDMYFEHALKAIDNASQYLLENFGPQKVLNHKTDSHYGIEEDIKCNGLYEEYFRKNTPEAGLFTEEGERSLEGEFVWIVDPIEGTSNYKAGNPFWATQVALIKNNTPMLAVVNAPALGLKFTAIKGKGAFLNGKKIAPTEISDLKLALLDMCRGTKDSDKDWMVETLGKIIKRVRTNRAFGSSGLQTSMAAAGITDIFINSGSQIYDIAPGILIAQEAGAAVLNFKGQNWRLGDEGYVVSNEILAGDVLKIING